METQVLPNSFGKHKMFSIFKVDETEKDEYSTPTEAPVVSFGIKKAELVLKHIEELKAFVKENSK